MSESIVKIIERRFQSANSTPVERAHITADEWQRLGNELRGRLENEGLVRQKACKADLDRALARVAELESTLGDAWSSHCLEAVKWVDRAKEVLAQSDSAPWLLRKQAEAIEDSANKHCNPSTKAALVAHLLLDAKRLREKAGQMEAVIGIVTGKQEPLW